MTDSIGGAIGRGIGILLAVCVLGVLIVGLDTLFAWFAIEVVAQHDLSFREALGAGLLLAAASGSGAAANRS